MLKKSQKVNTMNKQRRKALEEIIGKLENQKAAIEAILDEEQEAYDNIPESLQDTDRANQIYENIDALEDAIANLEGDVIDALQELVDN